MLMENLQEHLTTDFSEIIAIATGEKRYKDFKIPSDMQRYARDRRAKFAKGKLRVKREDREAASAKLKERLALSATIDPSRS